MSSRNSSQATHSPRIPSLIVETPLRALTAVDELKGPDCSNATERTEEYAEKSDYVDEDTNDMDKLRLS